MNRLEKIQKIIWGVTIDFLAEDKLKEKLAENVRDTMHEDNKDSNSSNM